MASRGTKMILATGNDPRPRESAFTLIELSIAVFIIAIIIAVTIPSFVRSYNAEVLNAAGRRIATSCEFAKLNAVLHQQKVGYYIDMDRQTIWLMQATTNDTDDGSSANSGVLKSIPMPSRIGLSSAQLGELMPQGRGMVEATFYPNGTCDAFAVTLHGVEKGNGLEIVVDPVTCRGMLWPIKL
jgi:prepilin-type N-terminal cleavage/methylation domain-containing protein